MKLLIRVAALGGGLLLSACATIGIDQGGSTAELIGQEWVVEDIAGRGVIDDSHASLLFGRDGRLSGDTSCNRYFADYQVDGTRLRIWNAGVTRRACAPAIMDQERRFLDVFNAVNSYRVDSTGILVLSTGAGTTITARPASPATQKTTYRCEDGSIVETWYPTTETARIMYKGRIIDMASAVSASGARYVGGG